MLGDEGPLEGVIEVVVFRGQGDEDDANAEEEGTNETKK